MAKRKTSEAKAKREEIQRNMEVLGISKEEAEEMWLYDHDEADNEEADVLNAKAETEAIEKKKGSSLDKVKNLKAKKKKDVEKEKIVGMVFSAVYNSDLTFFVQEMTGTKISFMDSQGSYYSVTVTKHKNKPDGFKGV